MKVVIASDSFKGCLTSAQVAAAASRGVAAARPDAIIVCLEVADGGEGLVNALAPRMGASKFSVKVRGPLGEPVTAEFAVKDGTAIIESASCCGLTLVPEARRNPLKASTCGLGQVILHALGLGCRDFLVGLGGSAANDAGLGMLEALGWNFLDACGNPLPGVGESLPLVRSIDTSSVDPRLLNASFTVACDVDNPFCGPAGAACVYAPQKGADPTQVAFLDDGMRHFAHFMKKESGTEVQDLPGSGAAGGLGGAFAAFLHARLRPGSELVLDTLDFDSEIADADMIITGEGRLDEQTLHGKIVAGILARAGALSVPVVAICGSMQPSPAISAAGFKKILPVTPEGLSIEEAMREDVAQANIFRTCRDYLAQAAPSGVLLHAK